jgi:lipopolysaccharide transport system ATP-binding protein
MNSNDIAIKVENISKRYRIGIKDQMHDSFAATIFGLIKSPIDNYRKYRSLYQFDDIESENGQDHNTQPSDIIYALRDVSFEVKQGEVIGIIGRNGAGKSTLLKILTRITDPTVGRAEIKGRVSSLLEVGTGFHQELTGRENVFLNGTILGMTKKEVDRKYDEIVAFSGVERFIDTPVKRYSSGMKVRLAFSVAAHLEPEILLVDEVLAVGDLRFQTKCLNKMEDVGKKGRTVLFVSHNLTAVSRLCDRTILMDEGRVIEDGTTNKVMSTYLSSESGSKAVREWPDPENAPSGPVARLRAVRVRALDGQITETVDIRRQFLIEMEYDVLKPDHVLLPHFGLKNEFGYSVFVTVEQDPKWRKRPRPKGRYISNVQVPGNLLAEGMLFVNCHLMTINPDVLQFSERSAVGFNVVDVLDGDSARGDFAKNMPGVVRPLLNWSTQFISKP